MPDRRMEIIAWIKEQSLCSPFLRSMAMAKELKWSIDGGAMLPRDADLIDYLFDALRFAAMLNHSLQKQIEQLHAIAPAKIIYFGPGEHIITEDTDAG